MANSGRRGPSPAAALDPDGGNIARTAQADVVGCATWEELGLGPQDLNTLKATDFEVIDRGPTLDVTFECMRTPVTQ